MNKVCIISLLSFWVLSVSAITPVIEKDGDKYILKTGNQSMTIDTNGGKILSLKYDNKEVISQSRWPESFGSTFWTSPQKEWNWPPVPEYDKRPYTVVQQGDRLMMTSEVSERLGYRIEKVFTTDDTTHTFVITYSIINESEEVRSVAPWEITRVPNDGLIFFDAPVDSIFPSNLLTFQSEYGVSWYLADVANNNRKVNANGRGWLAYTADSLLLIKQFQDLDSSQPAPGEAEIQVYVNRGRTYIEIESQGAYTLLKPKERLSWTVRWMLVPCSIEAKPSEELLFKVRNLLVP